MQVNRVGGPALMAERYALGGCPTGDARYSRQQKCKRKKKQLEVEAGGEKKPKKNGEKRCAEARPRGNFASPAEAVDLGTGFATEVLHLCLFLSPLP